MAIEIPSHMDNVKHKKGMIDLDANSEGFFGLDEFKLSFIFDDIVLVEFIDEIEDSQGSAVMRNGLFVPTNVNTKAWRKAKVVLVGPNVQYCKKNDIVIFPNDKGVTVANMEVEGYGTVRKGMFLNEQRMFGIATPKETEVQQNTSTRVTKKTKQSTK